VINMNEIRKDALLESPDDRRGFLGKSFMFFAAIASRPLLDRKGLRNPILPEETRGGLSTPNALRPSHLPQGYRLVTVYTGRPDGFGGGADETALWYKSSDYPDAESYPMGLFYTSHPVRPFGGTEEHAGEPISIPSSNINISNALYYDGMWTSAAVDPERVLSNGFGLRWDRRVVNAVVAQSGAYTIGVRGSKLHGVGRAELALVLASITLS